MKSRNPLKNLLYSILAIVLAFGLTLNVMRATQPGLSSQQTLFPWLRELQYVFIHGPSTTFKSLMTRAARLWALDEENRILRAQLERIAAYQAELESAYRDIQSLSELNNLRLTMSEYTTLSATVIHRTPLVFMHTLVIDAGTEDGVEVGDAIITSKGLIGRVNSASERSSTVLLFTTEQDINKLSVRIQISPSKSSEAILERYNPNLQAFELKLLETDASITEGMKVISSGSGGFFPSGLLVGTVSLVENLNNALGLRILVTPAADFYQIDYVMVVKRGPRP
jgi:rod shape-determining protein MreC